MAQQAAQRPLNHSPLSQTKAPVAAWRVTVRQWLLVAVLAGAVVGSALAVVYSVFLYRLEFRDLQQARQQREQLDLEWSRLLIEQQTFGATTQIGGRAVMFLRMYSPPARQIVTLTAPGSTHVVAADASAPLSPP